MTPLDKLRIIAAGGILFLAGVAITLTFFEKDFHIDGTLSLLAVGVAGFLFGPSISGSTRRRGK